MDESAPRKSPLQPKMTAPRLKLSDLPDWPRLMDETYAAAYLRMSPGSFQERVAPYIKCVPDLGGMVRWDRQTLDQWVDRRSGERHGSLRDRLRGDGDGGDETPRR